jgi:hypothetical protein
MTTVECCLLKDGDSACLHSAHWLTDWLTVPSSWIPDSTARIIRHTSLRETNRESTSHLHIPPGPPRTPLRGSGISSSSSRRGLSASVRVSPLLLLPHTDSLTETRVNPIFWIFFFFFPRLETPFLHWKPEIEKRSLMILTQKNSGKETVGAGSQKVPESKNLRFHTAETPLPNRRFDFLFANIWVPRLYTHDWVLKNWEPAGKWVYTQVDNLESKNHRFQVVERP